MNTAQKIRPLAVRVGNVGSEVHRFYACLDREDISNAETALARARNIVDELLLDETIGIRAKEFSKLTDIIERLGQDTSFARQIRSPLEQYFLLIGGLAMKSLTIKI